MSRVATVASAERGVDGFNENFARPPAAAVTPAGRKVAKIRLIYVRLTSAMTSSGRTGQCSPQAKPRLLRNKPLVTLSGQATTSP
jgi:hypothetical protein